MISITSKDVEVAKKLLHKLRKKGLLKRGLQAFALSMADEMKAELQEQLRETGNPASRALSDSLTVKRVGITDAGLFADPTPRTVTEIEKATTVIQVLRKSARPDPVADYLAMNGPWTIDTLPAIPAKRNATIVSRQALSSDIDVIRARTSHPSHRQTIVALGGAVRPPDGAIHGVIEDLSVLVTRGELGILRGISPSWMMIARDVSQRASTRFNAVAKKMLTGRLPVSEHEAATPRNLRDAEEMARRMEA